MFVCWGYDVWVHWKDISMKQQQKKRTKVVTLLASSSTKITAQKERMVQIRKENTINSNTI